MTGGGNVGGGSGLGLLALALVGALGCAQGRADPAPEAPPRAAPALDALAPVSLCATRGAPAGDAVRAIVTEPVFRAVAPLANGDAAALRFTLRGPTDDTVAMASGDRRRQLGLKLRAADGCNLIYVMWRATPKPRLVVSIKQNPGQHTHAACGADGYRDVKPTRSAKLPPLVAGDAHVLRAAIDGTTLTAWIDDREVWRGTLDRAARSLTGPPGIRSDNLAFEGELLAAPAAAPAADPCAASD